MKKSTGIIILLSFFLVFFLVVVVFIGIMVYVLQGTTPNLLRTKRLALVRIEGVIYNVEDWIDEIKDYQEDSTVKGIVLRVDSPGGAMGPSQELYDVIKETQQKYGKVIVASYGSVAASGGYYISCSADKIVSTPGALTGSIGVYSKFLVAEDLFNKIGIDYETVKAGKYKDFGSMEKELSKEEREMMQSVINDSYMQFVEAVMEGRKKAFTDLLMQWDPQKQEAQYPFTESVLQVIHNFHQERQQYMEAEQAKAEMVEDSTDTQTEKEEEPVLEFLPGDDTVLAFTKNLAEGKIYTGRQAQKVGLVDHVGSLDDAIRLAAKMVGISGEPTVIEKKPQEMTFFDLITQKVLSLTEQKVHSPIQYKFEY